MVPSHRKLQGNITARSHRFRGRCLETDCSRKDALSPMAAKKKNFSRNTNQNEKGLKTTLQKNIRPGKKTADGEK